MFTPTIEACLLQWNRLKAGERVVTNDETLNALAAYFHDDETAEAKAFFSEVRTLPNPKQVGVLDQYVAWIDDEGRSKL